MGRRGPAGGTNGSMSVSFYVFSAYRVTQMYGQWFAPFLFSMDIKSGVRKKGRAIS
ncbi:hypothetical protein EP837_02976 [Sphingobium sp. EP60837]|nr:hypothetical protein EP837_02976 [Sphingobium sp. EP60837]